MGWGKTVIPGITKGKPWIQVTTKWRSSEGCAQTQGQSSLVDSIKWCVYKLFHKFPTTIAQTERIFHRKDTSRKKRKEGSCDTQRAREGRTDRLHNLPSNCCNKIACYTSLFPPQMHNLLHTCMQVPQDFPHTHLSAGAIRASHTSSPLIFKGKSRPTQPKCLQSLLTLSHPLLRRQQAVHLALLLT